MAVVEFKNHDHGDGNLRPYKNTCMNVSERLSFKQFTIQNFIGGNRALQTVSLLRAGVSQLIFP